MFVRATNLPLSGKRLSNLFRENDITVLPVEQALRNPDSLFIISEGAQSE